MNAFEWARRASENSIPTECDGPRFPRPAPAAIDPTARVAPSRRSSDSRTSRGSHRVVFASLLIGALALASLLGCEARSPVAEGPRTESTRPGDAPLASQEDPAVSETSSSTANASTESDPTVTPGAPYLETEEEVVANVLGQELGPGTVANLGLPLSFVRRIADRVLAESYRGRFHRVVGGPAGAPPEGERPESGWTAEDLDRFRERTGWEVELPPEEGAELAEARDRLAVERPANRGYRLPLRVERGVNEWPVTVPAADSPLGPAAALVAQELATAGIVRTTARAMVALHPDPFLSATEEDLATLRAVGLPTDWLDAFEPTGSGRRLVRELAAILVDEGEGATLDARIERATFDYRPRHGFRAASESGETVPGLFRLQVTRADYWGGPGDGGSLSIAEQLLRVRPETPAVIHLQDRFLDVLATTVTDWELPPRSRVRVELSARLISQWAQDNGKAGSIAEQSRTVLATLVPRYASRREDGSLMIPADGFVGESLLGADHRVIQSPLLFQGGDCWVVTDPRDGSRRLVLGEAEVHRNTALGLTREQVLTAFVAEFGVDRCDVLPSISFHVDYDVCFRAQGGELVAYVNDTQAAVDAIIPAGLDALESGGLLTAEAAAEARTAWSRRDRNAFLEAVAPAIYRRFGPDGAFPFAGVAEHFAGGRPSAAIANLSRFLTALDLFASRGLDAEALTSPGLPGAYVRACKRRWQHEAELAGQLEALGFRVVKIPSLSDGFQGLTAINGIHLADTYLMPAYGGLYRDLDAKARAAWEAALGPEVDVVPIVCTESQGRQGALHCAIAVYPKVEP